MPKITRKSGSKKNRKVSRPNVYAQTQPTERAVDDSQAAVTTSTSANTVPRTRARVERTTRIAGARSEIFTRSMPAELRKLGALASVIAVVLIVLTFTI
jgi:hypothetical protein